MQIANTNAGQPERHSQIMIWLIAATVTLLTLWSAYAPLDEIVRGGGKVIPSSRTQVIQSLEGGILAEVLAWEGMEVSQGEVLAYLDDTRYKGAFEEMGGQVVATQARLHRLQQELTFAEALELPPALSAQDTDVARSEVQLFNARKQEYLSTRDSMRRALVLQSKEVAMLTPLARDKLIPAIDLLNAEQQHTQTQADLAAFESEYLRVRAEEYATSLTELQQMQANLAIRRDQLQRTSLVAPVNAIVNDVLITTTGGVVAPGESILELTPIDDELKIEAKISPKDVAFVYPEMPATVKLSAYDYTIYGTFPGTVTHISSDTFEDPNVRDPAPYYKVQIVVDAQALASADQEIKIRPGMLAETELHVGEKTVLRYLLKPLFKTTEAFREP